MKKGLLIFGGGTLMGAFAAFVLTIDRLIAIGALDEDWDLQ